MRIRRTVKYAQLRTSRPADKKLLAFRSEEDGTCIVHRGTISVYRSISSRALTLAVLRL
jgi:hypothetical protein